MLKKELTELWQTVPQRFIMEHGIPESKGMDEGALYYEFGEWCEVNEVRNPVKTKANPQAAFVIAIKNFVTKDGRGLYHAIEVPERFRT
jgi:hypothetical protein